MLNTTIQFYKIKASYHPNFKSPNVTEVFDDHGIYFKIMLGKNNGLLSTAIVL